MHANQHTVEVTKIWGFQVSGFAFYIIFIVRWPEIRAYIACWMILNKKILIYCDIFSFILSCFLIKKKNYLVFREGGREKVKVSATPRPGPWQRFMALPLWHLQFHAPFPKILDMPLVAKVTSINFSKNLRSYSHFTFAMGTRVFHFFNFFSNQAALWTNS